jgi:deaminated glutathione amidase
MSIKVAAVQMETGLSKDDNVAAAVAMIEEAAGNGADLACLPEYFTYLAPEEGYGEAAETVDGPTLSRLGDLAARLGILIHAGSWVEPSPHPGKFYNTSVIIDRAGKPHGVYRKMHPFDIDVPDEVTDQESAFIAAGDELVVVELPEFTAGMSICFDLRFPELYRNLAAAGAQVLFVPSAFAYATGRVHWKVLLQARAIENHAYVVAACTAGDLCGEPHWGHSMIVDPWGAVLAEGPEDGAAIVYADIDVAEVERRRGQVPVLSVRRPDLYAKPVRVETV